MLMSFSLTTHYLHLCGGQKKVAQIRWFHNMSLEYIQLNGMCVCVSTGWDWNLSTSDNIHQITCWYYKW